MRYEELEQEERARRQAARTEAEARMEHPALTALLKIRDITGSTGGPKAMVREFKFLAEQAIPALEALIAERDELRIDRDALARAEEIQRETKGQRIAELKGLIEDQRLVLNKTQRQADIYRVERDALRHTLNKARSILESNGLPTRWMDAARAAIAKAKGDA